MVDDGSTDNTASIARSYPDVRYIYQENQGPVVARNTGLANCTGELISFLDALTTIGLLKSYGIRAIIWQRTRKWDASLPNRVTSFKKE